MYWKLYENRNKNTFFKCIFWTIYQYDMLFIKYDRWVNAPIAMYINSLHTARWNSEYDKQYWLDVAAGLYDNLD